MEDLKPCPRCGNKPKIISDENYDGFEVMCSKCDFKIDGWFDGYYEGDLPAKRAWNTRASKQ